MYGKLHFPACDCLCPNDAKQNSKKSSAGNTLFARVRNKILFYKLMKISGKFNVFKYALVQTETKVT